MKLTLELGPDDSDLIGVIAKWHKQRQLKVAVEWPEPSSGLLSTVDKLRAPRKSNDQQDASQPRAESRPHSTV